jgi:uncharacterized protein YndB with AHSA1/START domain
MAHRPAAIAVQTFAVAPQRVYDAILDPAMIARFMFGPLLRDEEILHIRNEPRVGGAFSYKVRRGDIEIDHIGTYLELDPPGRIVFTWSIAGQGDDDPSIVTLVITRTADGCSLRLTHEMDEKWADFVDRSRAGWQKMLGVLAKLL